MSDDPEKLIPSARPGSRAPHASLADGRSTLDLFGRGFVLMRLGDVPTAALEQAVKTRGVPLAVSDIVAPEVAVLYGEKLVLVRPDGHVAWRGNAVPRDAGELIDRVRGVI